MEGGSATGAPDTITKKGMVTLGIIHGGGPARARRAERAFCNRRGEKILKSGQCGGPRELSNLTLKQPWKEHELTSKEWTELAEFLEVDLMEVLMMSGPALLRAVAEKIQQRQKRTLLGRIFSGKSRG